MTDLDRVRRQSRFSTKVLVNDIKDDDAGPSSVRLHTDAGP